MNVTKVNNEWCAFAPNGREIARSHDKQLLLDYLNDTDTPMEATMDKISYRTRARSTGAATASGRTTGKEWGAMCVSHGTVVAAESGGAAEKLTSKPEEWCLLCTQISMGEMPKVKKDAELDELL